MEKKGHSGCKYGSNQTIKPESISQQNAVVEKKITMNPSTLVSMSMWARKGLKWAIWVLSRPELEMGKFCWSHLVSVKWVPYVKPKWS